MSQTITSSPGIYEILNTKNGHRYIGSAASLYARKRVHIHKLKKGNHHNNYLQHAWELYGEESFEFRVICILDKENLILFEQRFMDALDPEYNICRTAGSVLGRKISIETLEKLSIAATNHRHSEEHKAKIGAAQLGRKRSEETKAKHRKANEYQSPEKIEKCRVSKLGNQWNVGKHHSPETKAKMSASRKAYWERKRNGSNN